MVNRVDVSKPENQKSQNFGAIANKKKMTSNNSTYNGDDDDDDDDDNNKEQKPDQEFEQVTSHEHKEEHSDRQRPHFKGSVKNEKVHNQPSDGKINGDEEPEKGDRL